MGDRFILTVQCPECGSVEWDVYYAPTCGFLTHLCFLCGHEIDLVEMFDETYEEVGTER